MQWNSAHVIFPDTRKGYPLRHQKSICDGRIRLSRYFRYYVTLSFLVLFPAARSNPQLLRSRLRRLPPSKKTAAALRASGEWAGIGSSDLANEENKWPLGTDTRELEDISARRLFSFPLSSLVLSLPAPLTVYFPAHSESRGIRKKVYEFLSAQTDTLNVRY